MSGDQAGLDGTDPVLACPDDCSDCTRAPQTFDPPGPDLPVPPGHELNLDGAASPSGRAAAATS